VSRDDYAEEANSVDHDPRRKRPQQQGLGERQDRLVAEQARMDEALDLLEERLSAILGAERPAPALIGGSPSEDTGSPLTRFLEHVTEREAVMADRLRRLIDRIDL
jgi:hypothetical protein